MQDSSKYISNTEQIYGFLNYEQLLARAVDRCLFTRARASSSFASDYFSAVQALCISLVNLKGKPMRDDLEKVRDKILNNIDEVPDAMKRYDKLFMEVTDILAKYKMLFRSVMVEVGREQV
jgi:hypothetical protein